jgi:hypothetical protein
MKDALERLLGKKKEPEVPPAAPSEPEVQARDSGTARGASRSPPPYKKPPPLSPGGLTVPIGDFAKNFPVGRGTKPRRSQVNFRTPQTDEDRSDPTTTPTSKDVNLREPVHRKQSPGPADWVQMGRQLQMVDDPAMSKSITVRLGIDFGTAFTKVAIAVGSQRYVVDWKGLGDFGDPHLLPSELVCREDGRVAIAERGVVGDVFRYLKKPFIEDTQPTREEMIRAVGYLAWVMRFTRAWVFHHLGSSIADRKVIWEANVGIPTGSGGDRWVGFRPLLTVTGAAWRASQSPEITLNAIASSLGNNGGDNTLPDIQLVPEVVAQVEGYRQSREREDGLHVLVDIGASTLDIALFRVMVNAESGNDRIPVFAKEVWPLGVSALMAALATRAEIPLDWTPAMPVPALKALAKDGVIPAGVAEKVEREMSEKAARPIISVLTNGRQADPRAPEFDTSKPRQRGLRMFVSGGGARVDAYKIAVEKSLERFRGSARSIPRYSKVGALHPIDDATVDRISVAIGLTYPVDEVELFAPSEIPPLPTVSSQRGRPDRDELYPK